MGLHSCFIFLGIAYRVNIIFLVNKYSMHYLTGQAFCIPVAKVQLTCFVLLPCVTFKCHVTYIPTIRRDYMVALVVALFGSGCFIPVEMVLIDENLLHSI